jgi:ribosome biogenesis GTPase A
MKRLTRTAPEAILSRYKYSPDSEASGFDLLERAAKKRGFLISGGEYDLERMAAVLLDEYRSGKLGRITLEIPEDSV